MIKQLFNLFKKLFKKSDEPVSSNSEQSIIDAPVQSLVTKEAEVREQAWFARKNSLAEMFWDEPPKQYVGGVDGEVKMFYGEGDKRNTYDPNEKRLVEREIEFTDPETGEKTYVEEQYYSSGDTEKEIPDTPDDMPEVYTKTKEEERLEQNFIDSVSNTVNFEQYLKNKEDEQRLNP